MCFIMTFCFVIVLERIWKWINTWNAFFSCLSDKFSSRSNKENDYKTRLTLRLKTLWIWCITKVWQQSHQSKNFLYFRSLRMSRQNSAIQSIQNAIGINGKRRNENDANEMRARTRASLNLTFEWCTCMHTKVSSENCAAYVPKYFDFRCDAQNRKIIKQHHFFLICRTCSKCFVTCREWRVVQSIE